MVVTDKNTRDAQKAAAAAGATETPAPATGTPPDPQPAEDAVKVETPYIPPTYADGSPKMAADYSGAELKLAELAGKTPPVPEPEAPAAPEEETK